MCFGALAVAAAAAADEQVTMRVMEFYKCQSLLDEIDVHKLDENLSEILDDERLNMCLKIVDWIFNLKKRKFYFKRFKEMKK